LPNKKQARDFLIDLVKNCPSYTRIIIWDSNSHISLNQSGTFDKSWHNFIEQFKALKETKVVNHGEELVEKNSNLETTIEFVKKCFEKKNKSITDIPAKVLINIVGYNRGLLQSEIEKLCLIAPDCLTAEFIMRNAFPSSKESIIYKFSDVLETADFESCIYIMDRFLDSGINENVLAEVIVRKARWQLAATYMWAVKDMAWSSVINKLMEMGKFPSYIWHNPKLDFSSKKKESDEYQEDKKKYMIRRKGLPDRYFAKEKEKTRAETLPFDKIAKQTVDFIQLKVVNPNNGGNKELRKKALDRAIYVYLFCLEKLAEIRYGKSPIQDLQEMIEALTNTSLEAFNLQN
jgi:hypothetical protein